MGADRTQDSAATPGGRPRSVDIREVINAIFYLLRTGCSWRLLPHDLPPWGTVHYYFWRWRRSGFWEELHTGLREQVREPAGRDKEPSAAIVDSQSLKTTDKGGTRSVTMLVRKLKAASDTSWSIPWD